MVSESLAHCHEQSECENAHDYRHYRHFKASFYAPMVCGSLTPGRVPRLSREVKATAPAAAVFTSAERLTRSRSRRAPPRRLLEGLHAGEAARAGDEAAWTY
jgi:hypothetical protein